MPLQREGQSRLSTAEWQKGAKLGLMGENRPGTIELSAAATADREWERQCGDVVKLATDWLWEMDADLRISYVSDRLRWIMDVDPAFFLGKRRNQYVNSKSDEKALATHLEDLRNRRPIRGYVYDVETPSGRRYVRIDGEPLFDEAGNFCGYRGIGTQVTAQVNAEEKADRSFRQLVDAVESLPVGLAQYDSEDRLLFWNSAYVDLYPGLASFLDYGVSYGEVIRHLAETGVFSEPVGEPDAWVSANIEARKAGRKPFEIGLANGRWIRVSYHHIQTGGTISIHSDITEAKHREKALEQSERLFHLAFEQGPGMTAISEVKTGRHIAVNDKWVEIMGWTRNEAIGKTAYEMGVWADFENRAKAVALLERDGRFKDFEGQYRTRKGEIRDFLISAEKVEIEGEQHMLITGHDITERKQAERRLRESEARLSGILHITPEAVIVADAEQLITLFNEGAERIFGYEASEVVGRPIDTLIPHSCREVHRKHIWNFEHSPVASKFMSARQEIGALKKDGTVFPAEASISKLQLHGQTLFIVLLHDITERKEAERQLLAAKEAAEAANRAKSEFLANMSHELRTPLNAILGFSEVIRSQVLGEIGVGKYLEYAEDIHKSGEHLLEIIGDILDVARIDAGRSGLDEESVAVQDLIEVSLPLIRERVEEKKLDVSVTIEPEVPHLFCDRRKMKQIVINLLSNAAKFTKRGGRIEVRARIDRPSSDIIIEVHDNGIGMAAEDIPHVMEPFTQIGSSLTRQHEGTGLGLPLVKKLTELHGGSIELESTLGKGTVVRVRMPSSRMIGADGQQSLFGNDV